MAADPLDSYRRKRRFDRTPEPEAGNGRSPEGGRLTYAIQKHDARRLHYDLRLEWAGVLKSWAITRGPSLDPKQKRLAVRTEDHPLAYAGFGSRKASTAQARWCCGIAAIGSRSATPTRASPPGGWISSSRASGCMAASCWCA